jgi:hypothetical protein
MRAVVRETVAYLSRVAQASATGWNTFWFTPADPTLLGLIRILTGLMLVYTHAVWGLALEDFFGTKSWLSADLVRALQVDQYSFSFWWWIPQGGIWYAHAVSLAVLVLFTVGLWTRVTSVLALIVAVSYANRVPAALFGLDQINIMLTLYLAIGPSGAALSVDHLLAGRRSAAGSALVQRSLGANLALRLIQVHMCVIYFFAGISKLQGPSWWNGEAMWRAFANLEYQSADLTWLAWHPWIVNAMTHTTIVWEISFCVLIWNALARPVMLMMAVVLHVGIGACLGMWTFGLIMLVGCASFLPNEGVRRLFDALVSRWSRARHAARSPGPDTSPAARRSGRRAPAAIASGNGRGSRGA